MAGEWVPIDMEIERKPEVLRLLARTGLPREVVVYRLWKMWGWFSINSSDGTLDATPELMALACGGDADWWRAVESVGWLRFDAEAERATLPGWDTRFSKAAKARLLHNRRQAAYRGKESEENPGNSYGDAEVTHHRHASVTNGDAPPAPNRGDRGVETSGVEVEESATPATTTTTAIAAPALTDALAARWGQLRAAWNSGAGQPWKGRRAPPEALARLAEAGWLADAVAAIPKLAEARFFVDPVPLTQFCGAGFVDRLANDHYAKPKRGASRHGNEDRPPPRQFTGADADAFARTKAALAAKLRSEAAT
jgi:hypothetical protein